MWRCHKEQNLFVFAFLDYSSHFVETYIYTRIDML